MRKFMIALFILMLPVAVQAADTYEIDSSHTKVLFFVDHLGFSQMIGWFDGVEGQITLDEQKPRNSSVEVTMPAENIYTGIPALDKKLRGEEFLNASKFSTVKFVSEKVDQQDEKTARVHGQLTLHGVTKPVVLDVTLNKIGENTYSNTMVAGFSAETTLKRSDFGVDAYLPAVGDEVRVVIQAEAGRPKMKEFQK